MCGILNKKTESTRVTAVELILIVSYPLKDFFSVQLQQNIYKSKSIEQKSPGNEIKQAVTQQQNNMPGQEKVNKAKELLQYHATQLKQTHLILFIATNHLHRKGLPQHG